MLTFTDDGTVIGLTRPEMEASLRTLEQMAADIGGTVMILREVVLYGSVSNLPSPAPALSSSVSSSASLSDNGPPELWTIRRPDLDDRGQPRRGSHAVKGEPVITRRARVRAKWQAGPSDYIRGDRKLIFGAEDLALAEGEAISDEASPEQHHRETSAMADEDVPPFHLDLENAPVPIAPQAQAAPRASPKVKAKPPRPPPQGKKAREKAEKSAARREQRRLDLFKGDGTNPDWALMAEAATSEARAHLPILPATTAYHDTQPHSSLRLASTATSPEEDLFLAELLRFPLDNLSLSFAEVRTVTEPGACRSTSSLASSPSARTELARSPAPEDESAVQPVASGRLGPGTRYVPPLPGEELICVEALVIRKSATEDQWGGEEEDGGCSAVQEEEDPWDFFG